jgi:hypothetical protein
MRLSIEHSLAIPAASRGQVRCCVRSRAHLPCRGNCLGLGKAPSHKSITLTQDANWRGNYRSSTFTALNTI